MTDLSPSTNSPLRPRFTPPCIKRRADGTACLAPATVNHPLTGRLVCAAHAGATAAPLAVRAVVTPHNPTHNTPPATAAAGHVLRHTKPKDPQP
jgi:hypothetical protein